MWRGVQLPRVLSIIELLFLQACTNTVLSHFVSLTINLWLLRIINTGVGIPPSTAQAQAKAA